MKLDITLKGGERQELDVTRLYIHCTAGEFQLIERERPKVLDVIAIENSLYVQPSSGNSIRIFEGDSLGAR